MFPAMQATVPVAPETSEFAAAAFQAVVTGLLAALCFGVWRRTRESHFGWWTVAFTIYAVRIGAIIAFLVSVDRDWLFWHQVVTGWTAVALLQAALAFADRGAWRHWRWVLVIFPPLWSYVAVHRLDNFTLAAVPAVLFISGATMATGIVLLRSRKPSTFGAGSVLGWSFIVWGLHHLDYPILRAQGAWLPWGYYLDILFVLAVGAGILLLVNADLATRLQARTFELERLSQRMVRQHEDERRRLSIALHDETAQVFAAVKMQLGVVRENVAPEVAERFDRALNLFDEGIHGVRRVTHDLRPELLDDLGLLPALRSLVAEFSARSGSPASLLAPDVLPVLGADAELAIYRAVQESLSNVSRHAPGSAVMVTIETERSVIRLEIRDEGPGLATPDALTRAEAAGHLGIVGMRERITALDGVVAIAPGSARGLAVRISLPIVEERGE
jgi:signal transduction histidine kinase